MENPPAINIAAHTIHHSWPRRYVPIASQLCAARGYASNARLKMEFATFRSPPEDISAHQEIYKTHLSTLPPPPLKMCACDTSRKECINSNQHSWIHVTDITSTVKSIFASVFYFSLVRCLIFQNSTEPNILVLYVRVYGFHLLPSSTIHSCPRPHRPIGSIFTFASGVTTLTLL